jgi:hypothetical protein
MTIHEWIYKLLISDRRRTSISRSPIISTPSISEKYIQDKKEEKKKGNVFSSLVRNAKMTPAEAKAAVQV